MERSGTLGQKAGEKESPNGAVLKADKSIAPSELGSSGNRLPRVPLRFTLIVSKVQAGEVLMCTRSSSRFLSFLLLLSFFVKVVEKWEKMV